jgi:hypothetical protein
MTRYWLSAHTYVAVLGPQTVFFDSKKRSFCALRSSWVYSLRSIIEEWNMPEAQGKDVSASAAECADYLAKRNLLTTSRALGKSMEQLQFDPAMESLVEPETLNHISVGPVRAARILHSAMVAAWRFRHRTFDELLEELDRRRRAHDAKRPCPSVQQVSQLVSIYWRFRPVLPLGKHTDTLDSLTLIEYLSNFSSFPRLVVGVRLMPFTTHTWVQEGRAVLNDNPEYVGQFTPIFSA